MTVLLFASVLAAGGLAFWTFVRFPGLVPKHISMGFLHLLASLAVARIALVLVPAAVMIPTVGLYIIVLGLVVVPIGYMFLSSMWLLAAAVRAAFTGGVH